MLVAAVNPLPYLCHKQHQDGPGAGRTNAWYWRAPLSDYSLPGTGMDNREELSNSNENEGFLYSQFYRHNRSCQF